MRDVSGRKILIISGDGNDIAFVQAAKEMGLYVICCDGHEDWKYSPAKEVADEAWNINYAWTEAVAEKCRERGIDGVIAGYSESRVLAACRIARSLGTPFYATEEQIEWTRNKRWFKRMCAKHGVATPRDYRCDLPLSEEERQAIRYPVIIKPSDNGGRKGISICKSPEALDAAVALAEEQSFDGKIVIEEYVTGVELCAVYTISDGKISLSCLNDKYVCDDPIASTLCNVVLTPSKHYDLYVRTVDTGIRGVLKDFGATNGVANFQFIVDGEGIKAFEMGFRVNGNDDFKVISRNNGLDFMKMLIHYSITGEMGDDLTRDDPRFKRYTCTLCQYLHGGTIAKIECEALRENAHIEDVTILKKPGAVVVEDGTNRQKAMLVKMSADTLEEICALIDAAQQSIAITDTEGKSMLLKAFDTRRLQ